jgi:hypothetical protein
MSNLRAPQKSVRELTLSFVKYEKPGDSFLFGSLSRGVSRGPWDPRPPGSEADPRGLEGPQNQGLGTSSAR